MPSIYNLLYSRSYYWWHEKVHRIYDLYRYSKKQNWWRTDEGGQNFWIFHTSYLLIVSTRSKRLCTMIGSTILLQKISHRAHSVKACDFCSETNNHLIRLQIFWRRNQIICSSQSRHWESNLYHLKSQVISFSPIPPSLYFDLYNALLFNNLIDN